LIGVGKTKKPFKKVLLWDQWVAKSLKELILIHMKN
jgi:hypothetical protein